MRHFISITGTIWLYLLWLLLVGCSPTASGAREVHLYAAASLTTAFSELVPAYEAAHPGTEVRLSFGASSQLAVQIREGAPADLFASADAQQMERVQREGLVEGEPLHFASNRLVLIRPRQSRAGVSTLRDLARPGVKLVTTGPQVPIGHYTRDLLARLEAGDDFPEGYREAVLANVVSEEANVRQLVTKVQLGEADAAFVYSSDVIGEVRDEVEVIEVPAQYNVRGTYLIGRLTGGNSPAQAADLLDFILSPEGQQILEETGFQLP